MEAFDWLTEFRGECDCVLLALVAQHSKRAGPGASLQCSRERSRPESIHRSQARGEKEETVAIPG